MCHNRGLIESATGELLVHLDVLVRVAVVDNLVSRLFLHKFRKAKVSSANMSDDTATFFTRIVTARPLAREWLDVEVNALVVGQIGIGLE